MLASRPMPEIRRRARRVGGSCYSPRTPAPGGPMTLKDRIGVDLGRRLRMEDGIEAGC